MCTSVEALQLDGGVQIPAKTMEACVTTNKIHFGMPLMLHNTVSVNGRDPPDVKRLE